MDLLKHVVNSGQRQYFIEKVNAPLVKAIVLLAGRYPEPTHENVVHPNSHRLIDIRDEFFRCWDVGNRKPLFMAGFNGVIVKYEHSPGYRYPIDWVFMMMQKSNWKQWNPDRQMRGWKGG